MPEETYDKVMDQAKKENRKKSPMATELIKRGLPDEESAPSYQQKIADQMLKK